MRAYDTLSAGQRRIYTQLYDSIDRLETETVFRGVSFEEITAAFHAVLGDTPAFFWLSGRSDGTIQTRGAEMTVFFRMELRKGESLARIGSERRTLAAKAAELARAAKRASRDLYGQILYLHDHLVQHSDYQTGAHCFDAYGCIIEGRAVCAGYAAAFQLLMQMLGVECGKIHGGSATKRISDSNHEWNYIRLADGYYYVDVTWDDPVINGSAAGSHVSHAFFCLDQNELLLTHNIDGDQPLPRPFGSRYNYYVYQGWYVPSYSFDAVREIAARQLRTGRTFSVKFGSRQQADAAMRDLIDRQQVFSIPGVSGSISYGLSDSGLILEVEIR